MKIGCGLLEEDLAGLDERSNRTRPRNLVTVNFDCNDRQRGFTPQFLNRALSTRLVLHQNLIWVVLGRQPTHAPFQFGKLDLAAPIMDEVVAAVLCYAPSSAN